MGYFLKNIYNYILIFITFSIGVLSFLIYKDILVINFLNRNNYQDIPVSSFDNFYSKKTLNFYFWKDELFNFESKQFVWFNDKSENLKHFISDWLKLLQDENILSNPIRIENVAMNKDEDIAFISFDQSFFETTWSIFEKWNCIESLLKSIREANFKIKEVYFLVNNKIMEDYHLDFSNSWPIYGYY